MGLSDRLDHMTTWKLVLGLVLCFTPLLPVGVVLLAYEYVRAGSRMDDASGQG